MKSIALAIFVGAAAVAFATAINGRYSIATGAPDVAWRIDRWTGSVSICDLNTNPFGLVCVQVTDERKGPISPASLPGPHLIPPPNK